MAGGDRQDAVLAVADAALGIIRLLGVGAALAGPGHGVARRQLPEAGAVVVGGAALARGLAELARRVQGAGVEVQGLVAGAAGQARRRGLPAVVGVALGAVLLGVGHRG